MFYSWYQNIHLRETTQWLVGGYLKQVLLMGQDMLIFHEQQL